MEGRDITAAGVLESVLRDVIGEEKAGVVLKEIAGKGKEGVVRNNERAKGEGAFGLPVSFLGVLLDVNTSREPEVTWMID